MSGADVATGTFVLMVFAAGAAMAILTVSAVFTIRRAGPGAVTGALWGGGLMFAGAVLVFVLLDRAPSSDPSAERRAIETRAAELTAQAIAPGSALACLDIVSNATIESACEKALFATPETVASAVAYIDERLTLLASSVAFAEHNAGFRPAVDRLRHGLEQDRFGFVAHALAARGCTSPDCADFALLRDTRRVLDNMKTHAFEAYVGAHEVAWHPGGIGAGALAAAPLPSLSPLPAAGTTPAPAAPPSHATVAESPSNHFDYPSASSIPPVSIMSAEPERPAPAEKPTKKPVPRRQSAREPAPPPTTIVPQPAQTSGSR